jgi:hypothetical protein
MYPVKYSIEDAAKPEDHCENSRGSRRTQETPYVLKGHVAP